MVAVLSDEDRFWSKVQLGPECWLWTAARNGSEGYGVFGLNNRLVVAHRYAYEYIYGPIPAGLDLDHVWEWGCRHKHCVNPDHLEPVTRSENMRRFFEVNPRPKYIFVQKPFCRNGHPLLDGSDNLYISPHGVRGCRSCRRINRDKRKLARQTKES